MGQRLSCCGGRPPRAAAHPPPVSPPEELAAWIFAAPLPALLRASAPHFVGAKRERGEATEATTEVIAFDEFLAVDPVDPDVRVLAAAAPFCGGALAQGPSALDLGLRAGGWWCRHRPTSFLSFWLAPSSIQKFLSTRWGVFFCLSIHPYPSLSPYLSL
jgi:hypothetical protein